MPLNPHAVFEPPTTKFGSLCRVFWKWANGKPPACKVRFRALRECKVFDKNACFDATWHCTLIAESSQKGSWMQHRLGDARHCGMQGIECPKNYEEPELVLSASTESSVHLGRCGAEWLLNGWSSLTVTRSHWYVGVTNRCLWICWSICYCYWGLHLETNERWTYCHLQWSGLTFVYDAGER